MTRTEIQAIQITMPQLAELLGIPEGCRIIDCHVDSLQNRIIARIEGPCEHDDGGQMALDKGRAQSLDFAKLAPGGKNLRLVTAWSPKERNAT